MSCDVPCCHLGMPPLRPSSRVFSHTLLQPASAPAISPASSLARRLPKFQPPLHGPTRGVPPDNDAGTRIAPRRLSSALVAGLNLSRCIMSYGADPTLHMLSRRASACQSRCNRGAFGSWAQLTAPPNRLL